MRYTGPQKRRAAIKNLDQRALYVFGLPNDLELRYGNQVWRPHKLGTTKQPSNLGRSYRSSSPVPDSAMVQIWWCAGQPAADRLLMDVELALQEAGVKRIHGIWWDVPRSPLEELIVSVAETSKIRLTLDSAREAQLAREIKRAVGI